MFYQCVWNKEREFCKGNARSKYDKVTDCIGAYMFMCYDNELKNERTNEAYVLNFESM